MVPDAVRSGVAYLCGVSKTGYPVVYFPSSYSHCTDEKVSTDDIYKLLVYYSQVANEIHGTSRLALLADFRNSHDDLAASIADVARMLHKNVCAVFHFYFFHSVPSNVKLKLRILGRPFQKQQSSWLLERIGDVPKTLLKDNNHVQQFIDQDQLSIDFQGRLPFNLSSWIHVRTVVESLQKMVMPLEINGAHLIAELENKLHKVSKREKQTSIFAWYRKKRSLLNIEDALAQCRNLLHVFACPYSDPLFAEMEGQPVFKHARTRTLDVMQRVSRLDRQITLKWKELEKCWKDSVDLQNFEQKVDESTARMQSIQLKLAELKTKYRNNEKSQTDGQANLNSNMHATYQMIINTLVEKQVLVKEVQKITKLNCAKKHFLRSSVEKQDSSSASSISLNDWNLSGDCKEKLEKLLEHCNADFFVGDISDDCYTLYYKAFESYNHILSLLQNNSSHKNILAESLSNGNQVFDDIELMTISINQLISLRDKLWQISDCELRNQARLLVYRCSVLLQNSSNLCDADLQALDKWKSHLNEHGFTNSDCSSMSSFNSY